MSKTMKNGWYYLAVLLIFGSTWLASKYQLGVVSTLCSVVYRFVIASVILFILILLKEKKRPRFNPKEQLVCCIQGLFMFCLNYLMLYKSMEFMSTGLVAVAFSTVLIFNTFLGALFFKTKLTVFSVVGAFLGFFGVLVVFWPSFTGWNQSLLWGLCLGGVGGMFASFGNIASAYGQKLGYSVLHNATYSMAYGVLWTALVSVYEGVVWNFDWSIAYVGSLLYLAILGSCVAFYCYLTLLGRLGPAKAAYSLVFTPVIAIILSCLFEGHQWSPYLLWGLGVLVVGNVLVLKKRS